MRYLTTMAVTLATVNDSPKLTIANHFVVLIASRRKIILQEKERYHLQTKLQKKRHPFATAKSVESLERARALRGKGIT